MAAWEYQNLTIPLGLSERDRQLESRYYQIVADHLGRASEAGWQVDEPIDFRSALNAGRITARKRRRRWWSWRRTTYESVGIRLKRPSQS
jgi:hypothetical protein